MKIDARLSFQLAKFVAFCVAQRRTNTQTSFVLLQGMVALPLRKYWRPLVRRWDEMHVDRMYQFKVYCDQTSLFRTLAVLAFTPLPCLTIAVLADLLPLEPPERGITHSHLFWVRLLLVSWLILFAVMRQCRHFVARLSMELTEIIVASFFVAAGATASALYISMRVGFLLPFTIGLESPAAFVLLVAAMVGLWSKCLRRSKSLQQELFNYVLVIMTQLTFTYVYPTYNFVFRKLNPLQQAGFTLLLPVFKIVATNWVSFLLQDLEDLKPEFIIFNIEVSHALFVSSCMQSAASFHTTAILMSTDFLFGALALRRILKTIRRFHASIGATSGRHSLRSVERAASINKGRVGATGAGGSAAKVAVQWRDIHFLEAAIYLLETHPKLLTSKTVSLYSQATIRRFSLRQPNHVAAAIQVQSHGKVTTKMSSGSVRENQSYSSYVQEFENSNSNGADEALHVHNTQGPTVPQPQSMIQPQLSRLHLVRIQLNSVKLAAKLSEHDKELISALSDHDQLRYVQHVLRLLFWAEFILLIEFTEMVVPIVYSIYLALVFQLPNRLYHSQLKDIDAATLQKNILHILLYAALEALTLLCMIAMLQRKLKISTLQQLAFVLESQWSEVQAKLVLWFVFSLQSMVVHYGVDFTFKVAWLHQQQQQ